MAPAKVPTSQIAWTSRARVSRSVARESWPRADDVFISQLLDPQVGVLGDQRCHLPEPDRSAPVRGAAGGAVVLPGQALDPVDGEGDAVAPPGQLQAVVTIGIQDGRQGVCALGDEVEAVALAQVAGVQAALAGPHPAV